MPRPAAMRGLVLVAVLALAGEARAQAFVTPLCHGYVASAGLPFDTAEHARWYKRFWAGECDRLLGCMPGRPNWNDVAAKLLARGNAEERAALQPKVCSLGQRIGLEWSREHDVRRINTSDLHRYYGMLQKGGDPLRGLEAVERLVDRDLASVRPR